MVRLDFIGERCVAVDFPVNQTVDQRIELVRLIQEEVSGGECDAGCMRLLEAMSRDRSWRVRLEVAHTLRAMHWEDAAELIAPLLNDANSYVKKTAEQSAKHQQKARRRVGATQRRVDAVEACIQELRRRYDKNAVRCAMKINARLVELNVGAMVHDLRNVITRLQGNLYTVTRGFGARKPESRKLREDLDFLRSMLDSMDVYARPIDMSPEATELGSLLVAAIEQAQAAAKSKSVDVSQIAIVNQAAANQLVKAVSGPVVASLANLLCNALEAFASGCEQKQCRIKITSRYENGIVEIRIRDNGMGMRDEEFLSRHLFVPGRRNKSKRHSTGFGLANAARCFEALGGAMEIASKVDEGTTVMVQLPGLDCSK